MANGQELDNLVESFKQVIDEAEQPTLALSALVFWVVKLIEWSDDPIHVRELVDQLIDQGLELGCEG